MTKNDEELTKSFDLSRDPSDYEASDHLIQRIKQRQFLEADIVTEVIEEGSVVKTDSDGITLEGDWLNSTFQVVVAPNNGVVQTAYEVES
jgi:hypothetical protein